MTDYFKPPKIDEAFKDELRSHVINEYEASLKPAFSWKTLIPMATSFALVAFVVVRVMPEQFGFSRDNQATLESTFSEKDSQNEETPPETIEEIEADLSEIETLLENDTEIIQAIEFEEI